MTANKPPEPDPRPSILTRYAANLLMLLGGSAIAVLFLEIGLRLAGISYPRYYMPDEYTGETLRPGVEWWWRRESETFIRINSQGLRDREHNLEKPPHTLRIAILGDSYAEAFQVPVEKTFWAVLEREMNRCPSIGNRTVEVINFGVSGYGTAQELLTLRHRVWAYSPDIVVLAFLTGNDISDNSPILEQNPQVPFFVHQNGRLALDDSFRYSPGFRIQQTPLARLYYDIYNRSRVLQVLNNARHAIQNRLLASPETTHEASGPPGTEIGLDNEIYSEPVDPVWQEAWQITEELIVQMRDEVAAKGAKFLVATLSNGIQVHPDPAIRQEFMKQLGIDTLFYPDLRLKELGERQSIPMLILAPDFQQYAEQHKLYLHGFDANLGFGHWNENGHRLAGEMIAQKLCSEVAALKHERTNL